MDPATIGLIIGVLLKYGPDVAEALVALFNKATPPTPEEWAALFAKARLKSYDDYIKGDKP